MDLDEHRRRSGLADVRLAATVALVPRHVGDDPAVAAASRTALNFHAAAAADLAASELVVERLGGEGEALIDPVDRELAEAGVTCFSAIGS
ncbi:hypothetical protein AB0K52_06635 [Glycomyces sp. NPDC049804]|uniref:hypothetical protein n=1 Tax=Glycomyces sp. NPDC049804 TaxID=3154363 RepID=UPI0034122B7E